MQATFTLLDFDNCNAATAPAKLPTRHCANLEQNIVADSTERTTNTGDQNKNGYTDMLHPNAPTMHAPMR